MAGHKTWAIGEEVVQSDFQPFVADQVVAVFASAATRAAGWPAPPVGAVSYLTDTDALYTYDGAAWVWAGGARRGTWAPVWQGPSANGASAVTAGSYTRFGNVVFLQGKMTHGASSNTGTALQMGGLPFPVNSQNPALAAFGLAYYWHAAGGIRYQGHAIFPTDNSNYLLLQCISLFAVPGFPRYADVGSGAGGTPFAWAAGCEVNVVLTYETAAP